ncbi:MAG: FAD-binding oxidoreductase, partial [Deltaproteobacteria bacterium]|nr:FAD-binding oxidoreductase [Deltaproteobacteria bacterium]
AMVARLYCMAQGTLGIITKVAVTLKTEMPKKEVLFYGCKNINKATEALKAFVGTEQPHEIFAVNKTYLSELLGQKVTGDTAPWVVVLVNRGADKAEVEYKRKDQSAIAKKLGGKLHATIKGVKNAGDTILAEIKAPTGAELHQGTKSWAPIVSVATAAQITKCSPLMPKSSGAIMMPVNAGGSFYYQPDLRYKESDVDAARKEYLAICNKMLKANVMFPRPSALIAKEVAKKYPDNFKLLRSFKQAIDPKNIMNPGKLGL